RQTVEPVVEAILDLLGAAGVAWGGSLPPRPGPGRWLPEGRRTGPAIDAGGRTAIKHQLGRRGTDPLNSVRRCEASWTGRSDTPTHLRDKHQLVGSNRNVTLHDGVQSPDGVLVIGSLW